MDYELAKQLKDAGFPVVEKANRLPEHTYLTKNLEYAYAPTLEELIEAVDKCCRGSFQLIKVGGVWFARKDIQATEISNPTPEEAVAKLWLALNN